MDVYEAIARRRSIRAYTQEEIDKEKLERVLQAARLAPSGKNAQAWRFIVVDDAQLKERLVEAARGQTFLAESHRVIVICVDETLVYQKHGDYMTSFMADGSIAMDHLMLAATAEGLGTCWIGAFSEVDVKEILEIPHPYRVVGLTPLGYPAREGTDRGRKPLEEIVSYNGW